MTIKHIICDWDETLAHTLPTIKNAYDCVFDSFGIPHKTMEEIKTFTSSVPKNKLFQFLVGNKNSSTAKELYYNYIKQNHIKEMKVMKGALELLKYCQNNNIKVHIMSSKSPEFLLPEIEAAGFLPYITNYYGSPKLTMGNTVEKPSIEAVKILFKGLLPNPEDCIVIGDGEIDCALAQNIACPCLQIGKNIKDLNEALEKLKTL